MKKFTVAFSTVLGAKTFTVSAYDAEEALQEAFVSLKTGTIQSGATNVASSVTSITLTKL